jgi:hypothetical protein
MWCTLRHIAGGFCLAGLLAVTVAAQNPTLSLEVTAVNWVPLEKPTTEITVGPSDILTLKIFARNWSPNGEAVRAMQAVIDDRSYSSGESGKIEPHDYELTTKQQLENKNNAYVDVYAADYIFAGLKELAVVDTISWGYRYLNVVVDRDQSVVCPEPDTRYSCGTLNVKVSEDALGTFLFGLDDRFENSVLRDESNRLIGPMEYEAITIHVVKGASPLRIVSSTPPSGSVDARRAVAGGRAAGGWDKIELTFNSDAEGLTPEDVTIEDGTTDPPRITKVTIDGRTANLLLDRGIRCRVWTNITHNTSRTGIRIGCLPGDVNNDGAINVTDVVFLVRAGRPGSDALPSYQADIDRDGRTDTHDALRLIDLLNEPDVYRVRLR